MLQTNSIDFQNIDPKILAAVSALKEGKIVLFRAIEKDFDKIKETIEKSK